MRERGRWHVKGTAGKAKSKQMRQTKYWFKDELGRGIEGSEMILLGVENPARKQFGATFNRQFAPAVFKRPREDGQETTLVITGRYI